MPNESEYVLQREDNQQSTDEHPKKKAIADVQGDCCDNDSVFRMSSAHLGIPSYQVEWFCVW